MPTKKWTEEEEEFLKDNYANLSNADLAVKFNITKNAVQKKLARMGLKRSETSEEYLMDEDDDYEDDDEDDDNEDNEQSLVKMESHFYKGNKLYFEEKNYVQAIEEFKKSITEDSDELNRLKARYWLAEAYVKTLKINEAMDIFKSLANEHKKHYLGNSARRRMEALKDFILPGR
jgi:TolA-binding protein